MMSEQDKNKMQSNPTGSANPGDKTKNNPGHEGAFDPKDPQDTARKTPSRNYGSPVTEDPDIEDQESGQTEKRRAS